MNRTAFSFYDGKWHPTPVIMNPRIDELNRTTKRRSRLKLCDNADAAWQMLQATEQWASGSLASSWTAAFVSGDLNSLAYQSSVLGSNGSGAAQTFSNGSTPGDIFFDISISLGSVTSAAPNYIGLYQYPLNQDGTHYGDNQFAIGASFGTQSTATPSPTFWIGNIIVPATGSGQVLYGLLPRSILDFQTFVMLLQNETDVTLASSANTVKLLTYNRRIQ